MSAEEVPISRSKSFEELVQIFDDAGRLNPSLQDIEPGFSQEGECLSQVYEVFC